MVTGMCSLACVAGAVGEEHPGTGPPGGPGLTEGQFSTGRACCRLSASGQSLLDSPDQVGLVMLISACEPPPVRGVALEPVFSINVTSLFLLTWMTPLNNDCC